MSDSVTVFILIFLFNKTGTRISVKTIESDADVDVTVQAKSPMELETALEKVRLFDPPPPPNDINLKKAMKIISYKNNDKNYMFLKIQFLETFFSVLFQIHEVIREISR